MTPRSLLVLFALAHASAILSCSEQQPPQSLEHPAEAASPKPPAPSRPGRALLVGVTEYPRLRDKFGEDGYRQRKIPLRGPANDVQLMREVLVDMLQMDAGNITALVGWDQEQETKRPTRANILAALDQMVADAKQGELIVVYLSGHGCQQPDRPRLDDKDPLLLDNELDGLDELFLPADTASWSKERQEVENAIADDELTPRVAAMTARGGRVWLLLDSCHSGTMLRGVGDEVSERQVLPETLGVPLAPVRAAGASASNGQEFELPERGVVAMYAAGPHESAIETPMPVAEGQRRFQGVFTWLLTAALRRHGAGTSFDVLNRALASGYTAQGFRSVSPMAEGDLRSRLVDGAPTGPQLTVAERDGQIELSGGLLTGLRKGARLAVFEPGQRSVLGHVVVDQVEIARSLCSRSADEPRLPPLQGSRSLCPAEIVSCPIEQHRIQLAVVDASEQGLGGTALPADLQRFVAEAKTDLPQIEFTDKAQATWLMQAAGKELRLWKSSAGRNGARAFARDNLRERLENAYRVENLTRLPEHPGVQRLPEGLRAELQVPAAETGAWRAARPGERLSPGTQVQFVVQNGTNDSLDLWAFYVAADDSMTQLFPSPRHPAATLGKDEKNEVLAFKSMLDDQTLGIEHILVLSLPRNSPPLDWLVGGRSRGGDDHGNIGNVLEALSTGATRGPGTDHFDTADRCGAQLLTLQVTWDIAAPPPRDGAAPPPEVRGLHGIRRPIHRSPETWRPASNEERLRGDMSEVYGKRAAAVFAVRTRTGHGTGFLIDKSGHVLTNHHVIANGSFYVETGQQGAWLIRGTLDQDGTMRAQQDEAPAAIVWADPERDLALLRILGSPAWLAGMEPIPTRSGAPKPGEECLIIGHPSSGMLWTLRAGRIGALGRGPHDMVNEIMQLRQGQLPANELTKLKDDLAKQRGVEIVMSDCAANPGDSGGPLMDSSGQLVGVTFAIPTEIRDDKFTYHVHPAEVKSFVADATAREASAPRGVHPPLPVDLGSQVLVIQSGIKDKQHDGAAFDIVIARGEQTNWILIDVDGDSSFKPDDPSDRAKILAALQAGTFDAELAFYFSEHERRSCYDRDNDGKLDLVLADIDSDDQADVRFSLDGGTWRVELDVDADFVRLANLTSLTDALRARAASILRRVLKQP